MTHQTLPRFDATITLQCEVEAPAHVGSHAEGNIGKLWRSEYLIPDARAPGGWRRVQIPGIPGSSLRGVLRDLAMSRYCDLAGIATDDRDILRLLFKGGKLDKSTSGIDLVQMQWLRENCPPLALFGYMDNAGSSRGLLHTMDLMAWTAEGVASGRQPSTLTIVDPDGGEPQTLPLFPGLSPIPVAMTIGTRTGYRRDLMQSGAALRLGADGRAAIGEKAAEVKAARMAMASASRHGETLDDDTRKALGKESRREANESMPHSMECIQKGVPLVGTLKAVGVTEIEYACLALVLADWMALGCPVGGKTSQGFGKLRLLSAPAVKLQHVPGSINVTGRLVPDGLAPGEAEVNAYRVWVQDRAEDIRVWAGMGKGEA